MRRRRPHDFGPRRRSLQKCRASWQNAVRVGGGARRGDPSSRTSHRLLLPLPLAFDYDLFLKLAHRGDPVYVDEELACFRWYETSKSGAGYSRQVDQATQIAGRYGQAGPWTRARTQAKKAAIVNAYRVMSYGRNLLLK